MFCMYFVRRGISKSLMKGARRAVPSALVDVNAEPVPDELRVGRPACDADFFFSSRRRHTSYWRDWSSDVCSSDLSERWRTPLGPTQAPTGSTPGSVRSEERRVGKSVDLGGRRIIKKKRKELTQQGSKERRTSQPLYGMTLIHTVV